MTLNAAPTLTKRWQTAPRLPAETEDALREFPGFMRQILYNRGYTQAETAQAFLAGRSPTPTDPFNLKGMETVVERLWQAVAQHEPVAIYGDYDVDGVTATVLLVEALNAAGGEARPYVPNRFDEGYGLNNEALDALHQAGIRLVVTVDCGVRSIAEADFARALGLDLIITDHHHPAVELPWALAVINPKQPGDGYPDKDLAGVGLAYKIVQGLFQRHPQPGLLPEDWLDLVALGTVADLAPLLGENRELVADGLKVIQAVKRQGVYSLAQTAGIRLERTSAMDVGFVLGPRLNAAGRLESALAAFDLLTVRDPVQAGELAQKLEVQNAKRQQLTREIQAQAAEMALAGQPNPVLIFAASPDFGEGVVGLAASRLVELYYRPAIVAHQGEEFTRASCRSIPEFHITEALDTCADLLVRHGGHKMAAGFTVRNEHVGELIARLENLARQQLDGQDLRPLLLADYELPLARMEGSIPFKVLDELRKLQPTGQGNPEPVFVSRGLQVKGARAIGRDSSHLRFTVNAGRISFNAIAFRQGQWAEHMPEQVDLMYTLELNEYNGEVRVQLNVKDLKPSGS